jgi:hypothetical protein
MLNGKLLGILLGSYLLLFHLTASNAFAHPAEGSKPIETQAVEVNAADTAKLKELLENQKVDASFVDGTSLKGKVKEVRDGVIAMKVERSEGPNALTKGEHSIPTDKLALIRIAKYKGIGLGYLIVATEFAGESLNATYGGVFAATIIGGAVAGYAWGRAKDKKEITILIK